MIDRIFVKGNANCFLIQENTWENDVGLICKKKSRRWIGAYFVHLFPMSHSIRNVSVSDGCLGQSFFSFFSFAYNMVTGHCQNLAPVWGALTQKRNVRNWRTVKWGTVLYTWNRSMELVQAGIRSVTLIWIDMWKPTYGVNRTNANATISGTTVFEMEYTHSLRYQKMTVALEHA